jgi:hypothetical protein
MIRYEKVIGRGTRNRRNFEVKLMKILRTPHITQLCETVVSIQHPSMLKLLQ